MCRDLADSSIHRMAGASLLCHGLADSSIHRMAGASLLCHGLVDSSIHRRDVARNVSTMLTRRISRGVAVPLSRQW